MPNLRELLRLVAISNETLGSRTFNLLGALVDELEAQRPPEVDARIADLTADRDSWERQCRNAERGELAEAKGRDEAKARVKYLETEHNRAQTQNGRNLQRLTEAKAEIETLRAELLANVEGLMADAAIGRLVRGMDSHTRLRRWHQFYEAERWSSTGWYSVVDAQESAAEALRSIQEVGDAEA